MHAQPSLVGGGSHVTVPRELFLEAIAYVDAFGTLACELSDNGDPEAAEELRTELLELLDDPPSAVEEHAAWAAHPANVTFEARSSELVGSFLARVAGGEDWWLQGRPPAAFFEHAAAIRKAGSIDVGFPTFPTEPPEPPSDDGWSDSRRRIAILAALLERQAGRRPIEEIEEIEARLGIGPAVERRRAFELIEGGAV